MAGLYSGLYVAGASLVCFFLILYDIIMAGFCKRRRWLPCHYFSLNSITLTILTAAAKITVDLTTTMPSPQEQLSKLTGPTLICTCVCFLTPSLGVSGDSESWKNMLSLSILIITVIVNICIQMRTGIIILFKTEHIIIMCFMILLLLALLCLTYDIMIHRKISLNKNKDIFTKGEGSMLKRLKLCFLHAYDSNPQLELCRDQDNMLVNFLCVLSSVVVIQATVRSIIFKELKLSNVVSDYKWSVVVIIVIQLATILIGCFGTSFRWFTLADLMKFGSLGMEWALKDVGDAIMKNPILRLSWRECLTRTLMYLVSIVLSILGLVVNLSFIILSFISSILCCCILCKSKDGGHKNTKEILAEFKGDKNIENWDEWTRRKADEDINKLKEKENKYGDLSQLLLRIPPSQDSLTTKLRDPDDQVKAHKVSSLSVVILARIASVSVPSTLSGSLLTKVLHEVFEVIQFVDKKIYKNMKESKFAKAAFKGEDLASLFPAAEITDGAMLKRESKAIDAIAIFTKIKEKSPEDNKDLANRELRIITDFITGEIRNQNFASIEELYGFMEQLFVDMLNEFLVQLPNAIFKEIIESSPENHEDALRFALKVLPQIKLLEATVKWLYPVETNITHLIADDDGRPEGIDKSSEQLKILDDAAGAISASIGRSNHDAFIQVE